MAFPLGYIITNKILTWLIVFFVSHVMAVTQSTFLDNYVSTEIANEYGHTHLFEVSIRI